MKKKLVISILLACAITMCACGNKGSEDSRSSELSSEVTEGTETEMGSEIEKGTETDIEQESEGDVNEVLSVPISELPEELQDIYSNMYMGFVPKDEYIPNGETPQELIEVIQGTRKFVNTDDDNREIYMSELMRDSLPFRPDRYMIADLDSDGYNEIMVSGLPESNEFFHYEDGVVYGYRFNYRGSKDIHENGLIGGSGGAAYNYYYRLDFDKEHYTRTNLYLFNDDTITFMGVEVNQSPGSYLCLRDTYSYDYEEFMNLLERIEGYKKVAADYIKSKEVPQEIVNVLLHGGEFMDVSEEKKTLTTSQFSKFNEVFMIDKYTVIDLDGDGVNEVVTYFGDIIPLATIFTVDEGNVKAYTMLASKISVINPNGVCYQLLDRTSYNLSFWFGRIRMEELSSLYVDVVNGYSRTTYMMGEKVVSNVQFLEHYKELWDEIIPCSKDLSLLEQ